MDPVRDLVALGSPDPRVRFAAEERLAAAGPAGLAALGRLLAADGVPDPLRRRAVDLAGALVHDAAVVAFRAAVPDPTAPALWPAAVAVAAEEHVALDPGPTTAALEALVARAEAAVGTAGPGPDRVEAITRFLRDGEGFHGDPAAADDPRSSYLPDVLERRTGLPIALGVLWMEVAARLGVPSAGVGLPLHFVVRVDLGDAPRFVDAFHGRVLDADGCRALVAAAAGRPVTVPDAALRPLRTSEVLLRMLRNLRALHHREHRWAAALACLDRALHLDPFDGATLRERAALLARMGRPAAAARALSRALAADPDAPDRDALTEARRRLATDAAARN